jgi:hypothetical protein
MLWKSVQQFQRWNMRTYGQVLPIMLFRQVTQKNFDLFYRRHTISATKATQACILYFKYSNVSLLFVLLPRRKTEAQLLCS